VEVEGKSGLAGRQLVHAAAERATARRLPEASGPLAEVALSHLLRLDFMDGNDVGMAAFSAHGLRILTTLACAGNMSRP
jgi:hypothetical protein